jgi:hypothetical protein
VKVSLPRRRLLAALAAVAVAAGLAAAWATASTRTTSASTAFGNGFVTFRYPTSWSATVWKEHVLHFDPMVYLSTERAQHDPCTSNGFDTVCGWPVARLSPNGLIVKWENRGYPGTNVGTFPGRTTLVGGRAARVSVTKPGTCRRLGADETISVSIARPLQGNWTQVDACLRGPNLSTLERQVHALLDTAHFTAP